MRRRAILFAFTFCLTALAGYAADNPHMGTWKLNEAKSKIAEGTPKNTTVVYEGAGDQVKITVDGLDADGKPAHSEWTGKFDGKDYAVTGDATTDMRSYKTVNPHTLELINKKGGKTVTTLTVVVAADGKTRTVTSHGTNAAGKKVTSTLVYDKQ